MNIRYGTYSHDNSLELHLKHTLNIYHESHVTIRGSDTTWVQAGLRRFERLVAELPPQRTFGRGALITIQAAVIISFMFLSGGLGDLIANIGRTTLAHHVGGTVLHTYSYRGVYVLAGILVAAIVFFIGEFIGLGTPDRIIKLYPSVEISTGPEHLLIEKNKRHKLMLMATSLAIPAILGIATGLIDAVVLRL